MDNRGKLKTEASKRDIDLDARLPYRIAQFIRAHKNEPGQFLFQSECGDVANLETITRRLRLRKVLGWHSFRRFRLTHLRKARVGEDILRWWMGHSSKDISDRYSKLAEDLEFRKHWAKAAGLGFSIEYLSHPIRRLKRRSRPERYNAMLKADVKPAPYQATDSDLPDCFQSTSVLSLGATNS